MISLARQEDVEGDGHDDDDGVFGIPPPLSPLRENTPQTQHAGVGIYSLFSARKATPAVRKILRFFRLRLQGVTHYTLLRKVVCQTFPLDSLKAGHTPCPILRLAASDGRMLA